MRSLIVMVLAVMVFSVMPAVGEYYQYQDSKGNLVFTDDPTTIPENEQTEVTAFESSSGNAIPGSPEEEALIPVSGPENKTDASLDTDRASLNAIRMELDQKADALNARKQELESHPPDEAAAPSERQAYVEEINALVKFCCSR